LKVTTSSKEWTVNKRFDGFKELNNILHKNRLYMGRIPEMPPKRVFKKSKEVIEERIKALPSKSY
jgi:hypothetical protein